MGFSYLEIQEIILVEHQRHADRFDWFVVVPVRICQLCGPPELAVRLICLHCENAVALL